MKLNLLILLSIILTTSCVTEQKGEKQLLNFVLIMADDLGYGDISCYGNKTINTPNIDRLAAEGIRFADFHSNGPVCSPTRAALMTGKYQQRTGVGGVITAASHRHVGMNINEITIADELKQYGYTTGIFGKWHLGYPAKYNPSLQGFDEFVGYVSGNVDFHAHIDQEGYLDWWNDTVINNEPGYTTDLITEYGIDFIKRNSNKPFFLYLPHEAPHSPYQRRIDKVLREVGKKGTAKVPNDSIPGIYKEMVEVMDEGIGRIMQTLKETGVDKNTVVIFCSDNGANKNGNNGGLRGFKGGVYEGGHRVPAITWYPGKVEAGTETSQPVLTMDILPTMLDLIEAKPSGANIDGISIKNLLLTGEQLPERDLYWSFKNKNAIRSGDWKLVSITSESNETVELFNIAEDISEANNLAEKHPELVKSLKQKLEYWDKSVNEGVNIVSD
ncbi:MAG: sulfatase-like hydrolase/transferase [Bacteroidota bacterium]